MIEPGVLLARRSDFMPRALGLPDAFQAPREWVAVLGVGESLQPGLEKVSPAARAALGELAFPALRVRASEPPQEVRTSSTPQGFYIGQNTLIRATDLHSAQLDSELRSAQSIRRKNKLRERYGRPELPGGEHWALRLLTDFPQLGPIPEAHEVWLGRFSSAGHFCVVIPEDPEELTARVLRSCAAHGCTGKSIKSAQEIPDH